MNLRDAAQRLLQALDAALPYAPHRGEFDVVADSADDLRAALAEPVLDPKAYDLLRRSRNLLSHPSTWLEENRANRDRLIEELAAALAEPWAHVSRVQSDEETHGLHSAECRHKCDNGAESK